MALFTSEMPLEGGLPAAVARAPALIVPSDSAAGASGIEDDDNYGHFDVRTLRTSRTHEAIMMHPLPRTDELAYELDSDPARCYSSRGGRRACGWRSLQLEQNGTERVRPLAAAPAIRFRTHPAPRCPNPGIRQPPAKEHTWRRASASRFDPTFHQGSQVRVANRVGSDRDRPGL